MGMKKRIRHQAAIMGLVAAPVIAAAIALPLDQSGVPASHATIRAAEASHLIAIAKTMAKISGDSSPAWVTAVATTYARALSSATPGDTTMEPTNTPVYLLTMKGHFTARGIAPQGAAAPTGTYLSIVVNARSYRVMDLGLSRKAPVVSPANLGHITSLKW